MHGDADQHVPHKETKQCVEKLEKKNIVFQSVKGGEHALATEPYLTKTIQTMGKFFKKTLK
ncbi:MAG: prolyl oligopeptidase family serine peptidase [Pseudomonadales bacterium]|nr:prolyl oligopeptidase family serine peptidase [Candidatus Woesebacteria bacterium]MCB9801782.1 prolyl oligopeptidase family serine peptidase [Pseudomonadales bacterium]